MPIGMIAFWALIITALVLVLRAANRPRERTHTPAASAPQQILVSGSPAERPLVRDAGLDRRPTGH
ncbi:hypothetical protein ACIF8T_36645 [Streptomyces sp. NPDC085946]|uniref:hypothetical protein n=1 Tax=Streptomyces sp. NPDC085946 TaxID=3365744 RepID=UPI0037D36056